MINEYMYSALRFVSGVDRIWSLTARYGSRSYTNICDRFIYIVLYVILDYKHQLKTLC